MARSHLPSSTWRPSVAKDHASARGYNFPRVIVTFCAVTLLVLCCMVPVGAVPPPVVECENGGSETCTVNNAYGANFDGVTCKASRVFYPASEDEFIAAVAYASQNNLPVKVVSQFIHTTAKWYCPGGQAGVVIVTTFYNSIQLDTQAMTVTVDAGVMIYDFFSYLARHNLTFPTAPYWDGVTVVGAIGTGSHGSTLQFKGGRMGEYVRGVRVVVAADEASGWVGVREVSRGDELLAARLHLGLLGAISKMTLEVYPMWKREVTYYNTSDANLENEILSFARNTTFPDLNWYPAAQSVFWRRDNMVPVSRPGTGSYALPIFRGQFDYIWTALAALDHRTQTSTNEQDICNLWQTVQVPVLLNLGGGFTNDGTLFRGFPVVGYHNRFQTSSGCEDAGRTPLGRQVCPWDPRINGIRFYETTFLIPLTKLKEFILTIKELAVARRLGFCGLANYGGIFFRFIKGSDTLLSTTEDSVMVDIQYYRSDDPSLPRTSQDVTDEYEQIIGKMFNGKPHWGKNKDVSFIDVPSKYPNLPRFLKVRENFDPRGLFLNEWAKRVLGLSQQPVQVYGDQCAMRGLCHCAADVHCNPALGSYCRRGLIYTDATVCKTQ
ncbi:unnamed protein product [Closterium sp. Naga37s-1]|nr:unnamed protein product [Closterium sp. Naga37s-1]